MAADIHFVQGGDEPVIAAAGSGTLACTCGSILVTGYDPGLFLAVGIQCARCRTVTTTAPMAEVSAAPLQAIVATPSLEPRMVAMTVQPGVRVVGRAEMDRLGALFRPVTPADNIYPMSPERLDEAAAAYERHVGAALPATDSTAGEPFHGLRRHALGWAVAHLRGQPEAWSCLQDDPTANAALHVAAFLHFVATWSHHPLFPAMAATVGGRGCDLHGLAPFASAHCLVMMGNQIRFPSPSGYPGRIEGFNLMLDGTDTLVVHTDVFDRFEYPLGRPWDTVSLLAAASDAIEAVQAKINLRHPGVLILSPGSSLAGYDEALIKVIDSAMVSLGRKNRGLMATAAILLRLQGLPDPKAIRFGYGFFPLTNRHYRGENQLLTGG